MRELPEGYTARFHHYRWYDRNGVKMLLRKHEVGVWCTLIPKGGLTHCYIIRPDGTRQEFYNPKFDSLDEFPNPEIIDYTFAECSTKDQFCKKTGREIALGRATMQMELSDIYV